MSDKETKKNIEYWEHKAQEELKENNIMKASICKYLAEILRGELNEN